MNTLQELFQKYPYDPSKTMGYVDILRENPDDKKTRELLTMNFLALGFKKFKNFQKDELEFLGYLYEAVDDSLRCWKPDGGASFETYVNNHMKTALELYRIDDSVIYIPRKKWQEKEYRPSVKSMSAIISPDGDTVGDLMGDGSYEEMEEEINYSSMKEWLGKYNQALTSKTYKKYYQMFLDYDTYGGSEACKMHDTTRANIYLCMEKFQKDFRRFMKSQGMEVSNEHIKVTGKSVKCEEYILRSEHSNTNGNRYVKYTVSIPPGFRKTTSKIETAREIRDEYLKEHPVNG